MNNFFIKISFSSLFLIMSNSLLANEDFKIPESSVEVVESSNVKNNFNPDTEVDLVNDNNVEKEATKEIDSGEFNNIREESKSPIPVAEEKIFVPKDYKNIRYSKDLEWFSIINHDKNEFLSYLKYINLPKETIKNMYGKVNNTEMIKLNAYAYDYGYGKPNIAENYYLLFKNNTKMSFYDKKIRYADFLIRTGRPAEVRNLIKNKDCMANFKVMATCNYYLGVSEYLLTGDNKNTFLRLAKNNVKKAKLIYDKK